MNLLLRALSREPPDGGVDVAEGHTIDESRRGRDEDGPSGRVIAAAGKSLW